MEFRNAIMSGFLCLAFGGVVVACVKSSEQPTASDRLEQKKEALADRLDELENEWIRLKAKAEGKNEFQAEWRVMKDEIDESLSGAKRSLERLETSAEDERATIERNVKKAISELEDSIDDVRRDLG